MGTMLGRAPNSSQGVQSNNYDPVMSTITGAAGGFGFMGDMMKPKYAGGYNGRDMNARGYGSGRKFDFSLFGR